MSAHSSSVHREPAQQRLVALLLVDRRVQGGPSLHTIVAALEPMGVPCEAGRLHRLLLKSYVCVSH